MGEKPNLNRRRFLAGAGALVGAKFLNINTDLGRKNEEPIPKPEENVPKNESREKKSAPRITKFQEEVNAEYKKLQKTGGDIVRNLKEFGPIRRQLEQIINQFQPVNIPENAWAELKKYIIPLAATESRFNPNVQNSSANAMGMFQITNIAHKDLVLSVGQKSKSLSPFERVKDPTVAARLVLEIFDRSIYPKIQSVLQDISEWIGLSEEDEAGLVSLCLLNAYNAGPTNMSILLEKLLEITNSVEGNSNLDSNKSTAEALFDIVRAHRLTESGKLETSYGSQAYNYVVKIHAVRKFLSDLNLS